MTRHSLLAWAAALRPLWAVAAPAAAANEFDCMIEPIQVVEIRSPVVGLLQQVHARRGDIIQQGQLLVTIESSAEQSAADSARFRSEAQGAIELTTNKVAAGREKLRRLQELHKEELVATQARDDADAELKLAEAELKTARENAQLAKLEHRQALDQLNRRVLRSPFTGVVVDQYLYPGAMVDSGDGKKPILKIAQTHPLAVQAILPFRLFTTVKPGQQVVVVPEPPFTRDIPATIRIVDRVVDAAAGTFGLMAELSNAQQHLPAGIRCKLRVRGVSPGKAQR